MKNRKVSFKECLREDLFQLPGHSAHFKDYIRWYFLPRGRTFQYICWFRIVQYLRRHKGGKALSVIPYFFMRHFEFKYGIHANANIYVGKGLNIVHGDGVHLNAKSIGEFFTVYQGVTLGVDSAGGCPTVGDHVTIYTNAVVIGDITIGDGAIIGANAFVNKDVEAYAVVGGVPARIIKYKK